MAVSKLQGAQSSLLVFMNSQQVEHQWYSHIWSVKKKNHMEDIL